MRALINFLKLTALQRGLIVSLARREIAKQYIGSIMGILWSVVHPLVTIVVFWVVFSLGFRAQPMGDVPFVAWLAAGLSTYFLFNEIVSGSVNVVIENRNLIKKIVFPSQILPVVKILSGAVNHIVFVGILIVLIACHGLPWSIYYFQAIYYFIALCVIALGFGWMVAALNPFLRDIGQATSVILQIGMWATPIMWNLTLLPENIRVYFKMNPMFYIVQGYRESFFYFLPFWRHPYQTLVFWTFALCLLAAGGYTFKRLKPHFADVI
jgi:lipopolysaccharide transport system permease protein